MPTPDLRAVADEPSGDRLTIEQLAQATGMTVRNIRNHQSRGLLPPPDVIARTGYYGPEHVERLNLIREMQAEGFNLHAIKRLLAGGEEPLLLFRRAVSSPLDVEEGEILGLAELAERFGPIDPRTLAKAEELGLLLPVGDDRYEVPSPSLLRAAEEAVERGIDMPDALVAIERVKRHCESIARTFVRLFLEELWKPVRSSPDGERRWPEIAEAIDALKPVSSQTVLALFNQTMTAEIEAAFARELERMARRGKR
ncbi:MAG TPA: MerR family transcriptional regulator [Solirubrobacteraceae bacterium]|jgi:DNA-binding transcriptional MerR regulator|nr:MerR family transcriptional regulator [Solirubrobacteraceae bacterium]